MIVSGSGGVLLRGLRLPSLARKKESLVGKGVEKMEKVEKVKKW